jgi:hypothetical protein
VSRRDSKRMVVLDGTPARGGRPIGCDAAATPMVRRPVSTTETTSIPPEVTPRSSHASLIQRWRSFCDRVPVVPRRQAIERRRRGAVQVRVAATTVGEHGQQSAIPVVRKSRPPRRAGSSARSGRHRFPDSTELSTVVGCAATSGSADVELGLVGLMACDLPAGRQRAFPPHAAQHARCSPRAPAGVGGRRAPGRPGARAPVPDHPGATQSGPRCRSEAVLGSDPAIGQMPDVPRAPSRTYSRQPRRRSETPET